MGIGALADRRIVVAAEDEGTLFVARLRPGGSLDPSFDGNGRVLLPLRNLGVTRHVMRVRIHGTGALTIVGNAHEHRSGDGGRRSVFVTRVRPTGKLDESFGNGGTRFAGFPDLPTEPSTVVSATDGGFVVTGHSRPLGWSVDDGWSDHHHFVMRFDASGRLDDSFAGDGKLRFLAPVSDAVPSDGVGTVDAQGRVIVRVAQRDLEADLFRRVTRGGRLDPSSAMTEWSRLGSPPATWRCSRQVRCSSNAGRPTATGRPSPPIA